MIAPDQNTVELINTYNRKVMEDRRVLITRWRDAYVELFDNYLEFMNAELHRNPRDTYERKAAFWKYKGHVNQQLTNFEKVFLKEESKEPNVEEMQDYMAHKASCNILGCNKKIHESEVKK